MSTHKSKLAILAVLTACAASPAAGEDLFKSKRITPVGEYTKKIEGPAVDAAGNLYVVNFDKGMHRSGTIGRLKPGATRSEAFADLPAGAVGNGMRFDRDGRLYVADFKTKTVFVFEAGQTTASPYFQSTQFNQPNDLAMAADGTIYASDPDFTGKKGQIWRITRGPDGTVRGEVMVSERPVMGVTNGIDLSPDGKTLYVSESNTREIWSYRIQDTKLVMPVLMHTFAGPRGSELDGLRTDIDGKIFVARPNAGKISVVGPDKTLVREITLVKSIPSNLTFGGPDGRTVFVTQVQGGFIEAFRTDRPGREPCLQVPAAC